MCQSEYFITISYFFLLFFFCTCKLQVVISRVLHTDKGEDAYGTQIDDNEPTMADQLAILDLDNKKDTEIQENAERPKTQPPSADSVHVLLKQALHADDRALLLDCLYNQDDKVGSPSIDF